MPERGLHLFLGPDRPAKLQRLREWTHALGVQPLDAHQVDAAAIPAPDLLALCRQQPAVSPCRLVVVDEAHRLDGACVTALAQHADLIAATSCVILLVEAELSVRHPLARANLRSERFAGREASAVKPFALTDALGERRLAGALAAVHDQLMAGREPTELLALIAWQLNRWVMVKRFLQQGYQGERLAALTGMKPWQAQRLQAEVAGRSLTSLQELLERCWQTDVAMKTGRVVPETAVEQLVAEACLTGTTASPAGA